LAGTLPLHVIDSAAGTQTVLEFLADHVDADELDRVKTQLPKELQTVLTTGVAA
jgi:uncharacterized protein (DUF2267 family)